jgi:hypothetical protein
MFQKTKKNLPICKPYKFNQPVQGSGLKVNVPAAFSFVGVGGLGYGVKRVTENAAETTFILRQAPKVLSYTASLITIGLVSNFLPTTAMKAWGFIGGVTGIIVDEVLRKKKTKEEEEQERKKTAWTEGSGVKQTGTAEDLMTQEFWKQLTAPIFGAPVGAYRVTPTAIGDLTEPQAQALYKGILMHQSKDFDEFKQMSILEYLRSKNPRAYKEKKIFELTGMNKGRISEMYDFALKNKVPYRDKNGFVLFGTPEEAKKATIPIIPEAWTWREL